MVFTSPLALDRVKYAQSLASVRSDSIRKTIRDEIQSDIVFEERLCPCEHECESFRRIDRVLHDLTLVSGKTLIRHADKRRAIRSRREDPRHRRECAIARPFDEDSRVLFE